MLWPAMAVVCSYVLGLLMARPPSGFGRVGKLAATQCERSGRVLLLLRASSHGVGRGTHRHGGATTQVIRRHAAQCCSVRMARDPCALGTTTTRTYMVGLVLLAGLLVVVRIGRSRALLVVITMVAAVAALGIIVILSQLRLDSVGDTGADFTNGRASLLAEVWAAFRSNEAFGAGADSMRQLIEMSDSITKTSMASLATLVPLVSSPFPSLLR